MDRRRSGFALMLVLVAVAAIFAAVVAGAVTARTTVVEAAALKAMSDRQDEARTAAARTVAALVAPTSRRADPDDLGSGGGDGESGADEPPEIDEDELPEMPEFMKQFLEGLLDEEQEDEETPDGSAAGASSGGSSSRRNRDQGIRRLRERGLPVAPVRIRVGDAEFDVRVADAWGLVNVNKAEPEQLVRLFEQSGAGPPLAARLADELIDYRDGDDFVRPLGAEAPAYERRGLEIRDADLATLEEMLYLPSMTRAIYRNAERLATIAGDGKIHVPTAPVEALRTVPGVDEQTARRLVSLRDAGELTEKTLDESISAFARDARSLLRVEPSRGLLVRVEPAGPAGPVYEGVAVVVDGARVEWISFGPA